MPRLSLQNRQCLSCTHANASSAGFTLIELAIVLFIITLLLGGVLTPLGQQIAERQNGETRRAMETARIALIGYALRQANQAGPLPCPDIRNDTENRAPDHRANDGLEDRLANGQCAVRTGNLPWNTLGLPDGDAWGNRLGYAVAAEWATAAALNLQPNTQAISDLPATQPAQRSNLSRVLQICTNKPCSTETPAAALILSHGRNGFGAYNTTGKQNLAPTSADEKANIEGTARFFMLPPRAADRPGGEFDDLLLPVSADWLRGRLCDPASLCRNG
jgi:prepilin-type N-terminal cleavage/methylation domain-containing protein